MNKLLLVDVDGTICDFATAFMDWMVQQGHPALHSLADVFSIEAAYGMTREQASPLVEAFARSIAFSSLRPILGAESAIQRFREAGWRIVAITSCPASTEARLRRQENLKTVFGIDPQDVLFAGLMGDKRAILNSFAPAVWVDDYDHHITEGVEAGHRCFIIDKPWHTKDHFANDPNVTRIFHWDEIAHHLLVGEK